MLDFWVGETKDGKHLLTLLPPEVIFREGIKPQAIVGEFLDFEEGSSPDPKKFRQNTAFTELLHEVMESESRKAPPLIDAAKKVKQGDLRLIDARAKDPKNPPARDIIALLVVEGGKIVGYKRNPAYRAYSEDGMLRLPPAVEKELMERIRG